MSLRFHRSQAYERSRRTARIVAYPSSLGSVFALCLLFPYGLSVTSCSISQPLADDAFDRTFGAFYVIYAQPNAIAIAEVVFREIAVQVLFAAMLVDALH